MGGRGHPLQLLGREEAVLGEEGEEEGEVEEGHDGGSLLLYRLQRYRMGTGRGRWGGRGGEDEGMFSSQD